MCLFSPNLCTKFIDFIWRRRPETTRREHHFQDELLTSEVNIFIQKKSENEVNWNIFEDLNFSGWLSWWFELPPVFATKLEFLSLFCTLAKSFGFDWFHKNFLARYTWWNTKDLAYKIKYPTNRLEERETR